MTKNGANVIECGAGFDCGGAPIGALCAPLSRRTGGRNRGAVDMMMRMAVLIGAAAVSACSVGSSSSGTVGEQLGFSVGAPDEFLIISRRPLQRPPSFDLPRPQPGAASRVELDPLAEAHGAVFSRPEPVRLATASPGEQALLRGAGADGDNSAIRDEIAAEGVTPEGERQFGLTSLGGFAIPATLDEEEDALIEVQRENEALRQRGLPTPTAPPIVEEERSQGFLIGSER